MSEETVFHIPGFRETTFQAWGLLQRTSFKRIINVWDIKFLSLNQRYDKCISFNNHEDSDPVLVLP